ncbi:MAG: hypothetical protein AAF281_10580, partial [Pseudomonadota bacterium]
MNRGLRFLIMALALLGPVPAAAQDRLLVRSAEHPNYSRLLVTVPQGTTWALSRDGRNASVSFQGLRQAFMLENIFDRMPRTRIVSVDGGVDALGATLDLTLACSCGVEVSRVGSRFVAIDVTRDASAAADPLRRRVLTAPRRTPETQAPDALADDTAATPEAPPAAPPVALTVEAARPIAPPAAEGGDPVAAPARGGPAPTLLTAGRGARANPAPTPPAAGPEDLSVREIGAALLDGLETAAAEGLIDLDDPAGL